VIPGKLIIVPLMVIGQIWVKEVLVKDILDRWGEDRPDPYSRFTPDIVALADAPTQLPSDLPTVMPEEGESS